MLGGSALVRKIREFLIFSPASVEENPIFRGLCEPVIATLHFRFFSMYLITEKAQAIVSVPWVTRIP